MTYEELKKAYENAIQKCSELESEKAKLEKENDALKQSNENKDLRIEHLTDYNDRRETCIVINEL